MKYPLLAIILFLLIITTSCKRNYSCACSPPEGYLGGFADHHDTVTIDNVTRKQAEGKCAEIDADVHPFSCKLL